MKLYFTENYKDKIWVTSDTHFGHTKCIGYCNRPFETVNEMNSVLIKNWNQCIKPDDIVIHVGDFCFGLAGMYTALLNGKKHLVLSGHDYVSDITKEDGFETVCDLMDLRIGKNLFVTLCHYPLLSWNRSFHGSYLIYGHNHKEQLNIKNAYNICMDLNGYKPMLLSEVLEKIYVKEQV